MTLERAARPSGCSKPGTLTRQSLVPGFSQFFHHSIQLIKRLGISTSYWNYNSFGGRFLLKATWNYGKVECWKTGYEKRITPFYSNNVESTFIDDVRFDSVFP